MAEQFLEEIYKDAILIELVREYTAFTNTGRDRDARAMYNRAAEKMERILPEIAKTDMALAMSIEDAAVAVRDNFEDAARATAIAEGRLLPLLFSYMKAFTGIEVAEGKYTLMSADSGFLTVKDEERKVTLHSAYDPLWEAYQIAGSLFEPEAECYYILGSGLGYLPYQIWKRSEGAVKIVIFEEDEDILNYAMRYGVLSWIKEESLEIHFDSDREKIAEDFLRATVNNKKTDRFYISPWKKQYYRETQKGALAVFEANLSLLRSMKERTSINLWKNKRHKRVSFEELHDRLQMKEWIVVSAGPSLDEQIGFLKESIGHRGIIAVNTVLRRLFREGIRPDLVAAADQYVQMREHIEGIEEQTDGIPLIAEFRLNWQYLEGYRGPACFVWAGASDEGDATVPGEEVWQVSGSVAGLAMEAAVRLGAQKIWLVGQDLAYPAGKSYAAGMPYDPDTKKKETIIVPSVDGGMVATSEAFDWFRRGLEDQIARYREIEFYNLSSHGALINGCRRV